MLRSLSQDLVYAFRQLRGSPGFTVVAVLSLTLGIGANTAIFQLVDAIRLRMLPVSNPQELAMIDFQPRSARSGWFSTRNSRLTSAVWEQIRTQQQGFASVMAWSDARFNLANGGEARYAEGMYVSGGFFSTLGVSAISGRTFGPEDDAPACSAPGAVISHSFWQREFGGDQGVVGRTISLDGHRFPIVGVTPEQFFGVEVGRRYDVAIPLCADSLLSAERPRREHRDAWWLAAMGRLKPGWTVQRAHAQLEAASPALMQETLPPTYKPESAKRYLANKLGVTEAGTGFSALRRDVEGPLWVLMATTALVLLIACANLANLLLARASVREREIAVRLALGASRWRLIRQLLAESVLLAACGAMLGVGLAQFLSANLVRFITTARSPLFLNLSPDYRALGFTTAVAVVTCILFGLLPALRATHVAPASAMRSGTRSVTSGREGFGLRRLLVVVQVALSAVLLVGSLLFVRSLQNLLRVDTGFQPEGILSVALDYSKASISPERRLVFQRDLKERLRTIPGVISSAQVSIEPFSQSGWNMNVGPDNVPAASSGKMSWFNRVSPGYFETMGTRFTAGRDFDDRDTLASPTVAIVNETFARKYFQSTAILGRTFRLEAPAGKPEPLMQIVGVVKDSKYNDLREESRAVAYFPAMQDDRPDSAATYMIRVAGSPAALMHSVKNSIAELNPAIGIEFHVFSEQLQQTLLRERLMATLSGAFAVVAVSLAMLGLYGVIAFMVARRRNEIGIRIALGADRGRVIRLVMRETMLLLSAGLCVGLILAVWAGKGATKLLYGLQPSDPTSVVIAISFLGATALIASYAPARRAASLEPMKALRDE